MKRKKPPSAVPSDIRTFLSSPSPARKSYTPIAHRGISTRSASATARPGSASTLPRGTTRSKAAIIVDDNHYTNGTSTQSSKPSGCPPEPPVLAVRASRKRRVARECPPRVPTSVSDPKESTEAMMVASKPARGSNKENGVCASPVNEPLPTPHQQTVPNALSEFSLVPIARGDAIDTRGSNNSGYQLPLGEVVVGRDSVRDSYKKNSNKLRIGIPNSEEGISRDQATLRVCSQKKRVLVVNKKAALNPIRIEREGGRGGISAEHHSKSASSSKGISVMLTAGKEDYLYPGDFLELDAFRQRGRAKFRYVLYPFPPRACEIEDSPDGDRSRTEVAAEVKKLNALTTASAPERTVTKASTKTEPINPLTRVLSIPPRPPSPLDQSGAKLPSESVTAIVDAVAGKSLTPGKDPDTAAASVATRQLAASDAAGRAHGHNEAPNLDRGLDTCGPTEQEDGATARKKPRTSVCGGSPSSASARSSSKSADVDDPPLSESGVDLGSATTGTLRNAVGIRSKKLRFGGATEVVPVEPPRDLTGSAAPSSDAPHSEGGPEDDANSSSGAGEGSTTYDEVKVGDTKAVINRVGKTERQDEELSTIASKGVTGKDDTEGAHGAEEPPVLVDLSSPKTVLGELEGQVFSSSPLQAKCLTIDTPLPLAAPPPEAGDAGQERCAGSSSPVAPDLPTSSTVARGKNGPGCPLSNETTSSGATGTALSARILFSDSATDSKFGIMEGDGVINAKTDSVVSSVGTGMGRLDGIGDVNRTEVGWVHANIGSDAAVERIAETGKVAFRDVTKDASPRLEMTHPDAMNQGISKLATASASGNPISNEATGTGSKPGKSEAVSRRWEESKATATSAADTSPPRGTPLPWKEGDLVVLRSRFGKGQNKPGGVARVLSVFEDGTSNVKLVLGPSRPQRVPAGLLSPCGQDLDGAQLSSRRKNYQASRPTNPVRPPTRDNGESKVEGTNEADFKAETTPAPNAGVQSSPKLGDRAKVLYDSTDWYLGTVIAIRRGAAVTIRFDDGSEERVTLCPGDAELCADGAVVSSGRQDTSNVNSDRHAEAVNTASKVRSACDGVGRASRRLDDARVSDASGSADKDRGLVLTEGRAKALLDTVPEKLVGLTFQEFHRGYGGWWKMTITDVSAEKVEGNVGDAEDIKPHWPESVMTEQVDPSDASPGSYRVKRKVGLLLSRLRAWDKQRDLLAKEAAKREQVKTGMFPSVLLPRTIEGCRCQTARSLRCRGCGAQRNSDSIQARRATRSPPRRGRGPRASSKEASDAVGSEKESRIGRCRAEAARGTEAKNAAVLLKMQTPSEVTAGEADRTNCSSEPSTSSMTRSILRLSERGPRRGEASDHRDVWETCSGGKDAGIAPESLESPTMASAIAEEDTASVHLGMKNPAGQALRDVVDTTVKEKPPERRVSVKQRASGRSTACPLCCHVFHSKDSSGDIDSHLMRCSQAMSTAAAPMHVGMVAGLALPVEARTETSSASVDTARAIAIQIPAKTAIQMPSGISSMLAIGTSGDDLGTLVAAVEELLGRDMCPNQKLCDRVIQEILRSRCHFRTECLRRFLAESLATFPDCWRPLNWDRFEECLQRIGGERDMCSLSAHVVAVGLMLDCVERHRQKYKATHAGSPLAPLFVGSGGNGDGREALKKCARWAAKTWARRSGDAAGGDVIPSQHDIEARACHTVTRALCEATEGFIAAGSETEGWAQRMEAEGCQLIAIEVEAHCGELPGTGSGADAPSNCGESAVEDAARCRASLLTALAGRAFRPRLAGMLLENMQEQGRGFMGVEKLRALLSLARGDRSPSVGVGRSRGKRDVGISGSCYLYADLQT